MSKESDRQARIAHAQEMAKLRADKRIADKEAAEQRRKDHAAEMEKIRKKKEEDD